jgi:hypothetical protein
VNKCDETTTRTYSWRFVDEPGSFILQFSERGVDVRNLDCNMVHSGPAFREKLSDSRIGAQRLEQLDVSVAHRQHANLDALFRYFFRRVDLQSECIAPYGQTIFDAFGRYSDVINFQQPE